MKKLILFVCGIFLGYAANAQSANDAGVNAFITPTTPVLANTSTPVSVTIKNYGTAFLANATLGFSVNGVVQPTLAWTGATALAQNATSATITIGNFTFSPGNHTVKAWTKLPNGAADGNATNDTTTIQLSTCTPLVGIYTISKSIAASATNFNSLGAAAQALGNCGISGPVTFNVVPGSGPYNEQVTLPVIPGASATNTVTFEGNGNTVTSAATTASKQGVIILNGADYVKLNNFKILVDPTVTAGWGIQLINASDNNTISNCIIDLPIASTSSNFAGIGAGTSASATGNFANNLLVQNNLINAGYYGILLSGTTTAPATSGNRVIGNRIRDFYFAGVYLNTAGTGTLVTGNDISRPGRVTVGNVLHGIYLTGGTTNTIVSKNRIHNTHDLAAITTGTVNGIYVVAPATPGNENIIKNNLIYNINSPGGSVNAFYNSTGNGTYYYHNTVSLDNPAITYATVRGLNLLGALTNVKFINNILNLTSNATAKHAIFLNNASVALVSNNNDLFVGTTGKIGSFVAVDKATLADWQATNTNAYDQNSVSTDPLFTTSFYLQPTAAALNNTGQPIAAVTDDINGAVRSATTPDIGAYEFTPAINDAGITAIVAPTSPVAPGTQPITVTLKNFGTANLTSATIGWSVNGVAQANYFWSGSLANFQATPAPVNIGTYNFPTGNFILKVWSQSPNGAADGLTANDTTILNIVSMVRLAGSYTINKNNPTAGTNFQTLTEIAQRLSTGGVAGPVTITVAPGTGPYNEQVEIGNIPYASATNTVTFEGNGNTVVGAAGAKPGVFVLNGSKYVKLNNFVITIPAGATTAWGVQMLNGSKYNTISNNTIDLPLTSTASGINGIMAAADNGVVGNNASYTKIQNNTINGGFYAIQMNGNFNALNATGNQITGNQIKDPHSYGIYINQADSTLIEGNDISRMTRANGVGLTAIQLNGTCLNSIVSKNRIHNTHDIATAPVSSLYGIYILSPATPGNENIVKNNLIYNIKCTASSFYAFYNSGGNGAYYYNNTVVADPTTIYGAIRGIYFGTAATNVKFINNNLSLECNPQTVASTVYGIYVLFPAISLVSNNNNIHLGTVGNVGYYSAAQATLANWQAVNTNAYDQASVSTNPLFVNLSTGNLKPTSSLMDNLGQPIATVTEDILGAARNATTPDMGAYEFGIPANDVGITGISGPSATACGLTATEIITVSIKNFGANTQTAVPVSFAVNGVPMAATPETYNAAPLAPNATATYTFTAKANMSVSGAFVVTAKTLLTGDLITNNDGDTTEFVNSLISGIPVNLDFETSTTGISRIGKTVNTHSKITEGTAASNGASSTKGLIMDGIDNAAWALPVNPNDSWTTNPEHFSGAYFCISPAGGLVTDSLILTLDLKQLFKLANANTNFRVTVNGTQVGPTYRPPFAGTPIFWQKVRVNLTTFKNDPTIKIGLESNVKEAYANGNGTANLIDNIEIKRVAGPTGLKDANLAAQVTIYPNPGNGQFNIDLPKGKTYELEVTDLTGKVIQKLSAKGNIHLNLDEAAKGIYLLKVSGENGFGVRKLIVE